MPSRGDNHTVNRIIGRGLAIFIALYIAATVCFIILV
jgi:hypothetical protein